MKDIFNDVLKKLDELELEFQENKGIILTEYDLQCLLFCKLYHYHLLRHNEYTFDNNIKGSPLHTEISFFNENKKLSYRPDITIIETKNYSIIHSVADIITIKDGYIQYDKTSSKGFEFCGDAIIIELKFIHDTNGIKQIRGIKNDYYKINKIKKLVERNGQNKVYGIVAVFNKTDRKSDECSNYIALRDNESDVRVKYYTGKFENTTVTTQ